MSKRKESEQPEFDQTLDRRSETRTITVFRPVLIEAGESVGLCLVRNLSPKGMRGLVYTPIAERTPVTIRFNDDLAFVGRVKWCKDGAIGVRFNELIEVEELLAKVGSRYTRGRRNRAPRLPIQCKAYLIIGGRTLEAELKDISQRGIKVRASFIRPGDEVTVRLEGLDPRKAIVSWTKEDIAGLQFVTLLPFGTLAQWTIRQHGLSGNSH